MNIGIILPNLEVNQLAYEIISSINHEILAGGKHDYRVFIENISLFSIRPLCAVMSIPEIWSYSGLLVSTTLDNTEFSLRLTTDVMRVFYIWDMEWLRGQKNYLRNLSILRNPNLVLISRSEDAARELERYSNRRPNMVASRLSLGDLANVITN